MFTACQVFTGQVLYNCAMSCSKLDIMVPGSTACLLHVRYSLGRYSITVQCHVANFISWPYTL